MGKKNNKMVSVVVPAYNEDKVLELFYNEMTAVPFHSINMQTPRPCQSKSYFRH